MITIGARYLLWTMWAPLLNLILGSAQVMANTVETSTARAGQFALSWGGGLQNGPREISFDGERRFYFATGDTEGSETQTGVGAFELDLQNADLAEVKAAGEILCERDIQKGGPELADSSATFSVACLDAGELAIKTGSLHLIPQNLQEKLYQITSKFSDKAYAEGKKLIKLDFYTYKIEVKDDVYVVSVKFINSGDGRVSFTTPDQWTGTAFGGRLGVGGIAKVSGNKVLDKSLRAWQFALGGQKLVNRGAFPGGIVNLNPGEVKILQFQTSPNDKGSKGEYEFSGIAFMNIKCEGERWAASTRVIFNPIKTRVTMDHDYPSTPQEREQWEAQHRASMSLQPVKPGETFTEDGLYRAVRVISGASYRSLQLKPFKAGDIATTENVRMPMESASGVEINGPVQWVWEASAPTRTKPFSSDYIEGTEHVCKPGAPCPRNGRWIERTEPDSWGGNYTYRLSSLITRRAGQQMPQIQGDAGETEWEWVGA